MARALDTSIEQIIREAVEGVVARATASIARAVREGVAAELGQKTARNGSRARGKRAPSRKQRVRSRVRGEITTWVADRNARRVPTFVIEATGLDTKKKIVAKFGDGVTFKKGAPLPVPRPEQGASQLSLEAVSKGEREVKAKPPVIRKAAGR